MTAPGAILITSFSSLKPLLRRIVLRVHPDVVHHLPAHCTATNAASLQTLFRLFDTLRARVPEGGAGAAAAATPQALLERYALSFWHEPRSASEEEAAEGDDDAAAPAAPLPPRLLSREVRVPPGLEARCARLPPAAAAAQWLGLGAGALAELGEGLGLCARGAVQLAPALRAALREGSGGPQTARAARSMDPLTATQHLRAHLAALSPLQQGKSSSPGAASLPAAAALVADARSVFPLPLRRQRVDALLARPGWLTLGDCSSAGGPSAAATAMRLRASLVAHYDALHLYHALWPSLRLCVGLPAQPYYCDAATGGLWLPADYGDAALVHLVRAHWGALSAGRGRFAAVARQGQGERRRGQ